MRRLLAVAALPLAFAALPAPAAAQDNAGDKVNTVIIYGNDECPKSAETITVCARLAESERYRIPENLRGSDSPQNESWSNKVQSFESVGNFGPLSCTPFGAGGELGCTAKMIRDAYAEKKQGSDVRFSQLIAQARSERLSHIDEQAAETQARVEQAEKEYEARLGREQSDETPGKSDTSQPMPARVVDPAKVAAHPPSDLAQPPRDVTQPSGK